METRVLLIEDNPGDARLILEMLKEAGRDGFMVDRADHLSSGLEKLAVRPPNAVILDLSLPDSQGLATFCRLHERFPEEPIVVLTGLNDEQVALQAVRAGAQDYLVKGDISAGVLVRSLRYAIERQELQANLRQRTVELETAVKEVEAFSYSVSHDLRAPLRTIDGFSRIVLEDHDKQIDEEGKHYLRRIRAATQNMSQLIDALLQLSRVLRGEIVREPVDLSILALQAATVIQKSQPERQVQFRIQAGMQVSGDRRLLQLALQNLLQNAWKFTGTRQDALVEFGSAQRDGKLAYFVRDNGVGFDMAYAGKLFTPFQRLHSKDEFEGTGIGLATVDRIVRRHGGRIWADGEVGQGATFYFVLN